MKRDEAIELLRGGADGASEWNENRGAIADLGDRIHQPVRAEILCGALK